MNLKYYIRGLGAGLIIAASVLMISEAAGKGQDYNNSEQQTTTAASIIAYTTEAQTTVPETEGTSDTTAKTTSAITETTYAMETVSETQPATADAKEEKTAEIEDKTVKVNIHNVYYATQASDILLKAGVISDAQSFTEYLVNNGYAGKIREGIYDIQKGASFDEIAKIITQK
ncbi:MAG: hypothetical protein Q4F11_08490 [Eubacteriales bacterium]|nr:hypothetical protein [Eubacteriales bacterium]